MKDQPGLHLTMMMLVIISTLKRKLLHSEEETREGDDSEDEKDENPPAVSHGQACQALETSLTYLEQQPDIPASEHYSDDTWSSITCS